jgi:hypothetical protein
VFLLLAARNLSRWPEVFAQARYFASQKFPDKIPA